MLLKNGRLIDPSQKIDEILDVHIADGVVKKIERDLKRSLFSWLHRAPSESQDLKPAT